MPGVHHACARGAARPHAEREPTPATLADLEAAWEQLQKESTGFHALSLVEVRQQLEAAQQQLAQILAPYIARPTTTTGATGTAGTTGTTVTGTDTGNRHVVDRDDVDGDHDAIRHDLDGGCCDHLDSREFDRARSDHHDRDDVYGSVVRLESQRFQRKKPSIAKIVSTMIAMITQNAACVPSPG